MAARNSTEIELKEWIIRKLDTVKKLLPAKRRPIVLIIYSLESSGSFENSYIILKTCDSISCGREDMYKNSLASIPDKQNMKER